MKFTKSKLKEIITEELSNKVEENSKQEVLNTLEQVRETTTEEFNNRGWSVEWEEKLKETPGVGGVKMYRLYGRFSSPDFKHDRGVVYARGGIRVKDSSTYYKGNVMYLSSQGKYVEDSQEFIEVMKQLVRDFKFPRMIG